MSNGVRAGQQFVQQHAQRIDVAAGVDIQPAHLRLLGRHVERRADQLREAGEQGLFGQLLPGGFGDAEVDHLDHRPAVVQRDQHVGRLEVAVNDALLMGMLHRLADRDEQLQPLADGQLIAGRSNSVIGTPRTSSMTK